MSTGRSILLVVDTRTSVPRRPQKYTRSFDLCRTREIHADISLTPPLNNTGIKRCNISGRRVRDPTNHSSSDKLG